MFKSAKLRTEMGSLGIEPILGCVLPGTSLKLCESIGNSRPYTSMNRAPTYRMQLGKFPF